MILRQMKLFILKTSHSFYDGTGVVSLYRGDVVFYLHDNEEKSKVFLTRKGIMLRWSDIVT